MKNSIRVVVAAAAVLVTAALTAQAAFAAIWSSSDKYGSWSNGGYTVYNDEWGSGAGTQTIYANSYSNFWVDSNQPATSGVKSYPNSEKAGINKAASSLNSAKSSFNVSRPGTGDYETAYDIWDSANAYEIMLWVNKTGTVGPIGSKQTTASVGGHTWDVYQGSNGSNAVFSFLITAATNSATVDILAIWKWLGSNGYFSSSTKLGRVQFGFEISGTGSATQRFTVNSYSVTTS
jgi:hypothetical protein